MENADFVDQRRRAVRQLLQKHADLFRRQGTVVETFRRRNGRRLGPYYRLAYRDGGRQRSVYVGADPEFAAEIREILARLQAPAHERKIQAKQRDVLRRALRERKAALDRQLRKNGLYLKGWEVRGWRNLPSAARNK